jgi:hypothetical protein
MWGDVSREERRSRLDAPPWARGVALVGVVAVAASLYVSGGLPGAYLAEDDFFWLAVGDAMAATPHLPLPTGQHFYRPVVDVWFGGVMFGCGFDTACYHWAHLGVHLANVALVFLLVAALVEGLALPLLAAVMFATQPSYTQAVAWISAITEVGCTFFFLLSLVAQIASWRMERPVARMALEAAAVIAFLLGAWMHESALTLPLVSWLMWRSFAGADPIRRPVIAGGMALVTVAVVFSTIAGNHQNGVIANEYGLGWHVVKNSLLYMIGFYVGPPRTSAYVACIIGVAVLLAVSRVSRFGTLWMIVTMAPFAGFTLGNVSRYAYLPAIGFSIAVAGAIVAALELLGRRSERRRIAAGVAFVVILVFVGVRFGRFTVASVRSQVRWMEEWRTAAQEIKRDARHKGGTVEVGVPDTIRRFPFFVPSVVQWEYRDYSLRTSIRP